MPILTDRVGGSPTRGAGRPPPLGHGLSEEHAGVRGQRLSVTMSLVSADVSRACLVMEGPAHGLASAVGGKGFRTSEGGEWALDKAAPGRVVCVCRGALGEGREGLPPPRARILLPFLQGPWGRQEEPRRVGVGGGKGCGGRGEGAVPLAGCSSARCGEHMEWTGWRWAGGEQRRPKCGEAGWEGQRMQLP